MAIKELDRQTLGALGDAVLAAGTLEHLRLIDAEFMEFLHALGWFMGGPLDSVDAFLTQVPDTAADEHQVYWLRGKSVGSVAIGMHQGPEGAQDQPIKLDGWVRPISDIRRIDIQDVQFQWPFSAVPDQSPEIRPTLEIHFDDLDMVVGAAGRTSQRARDQAATFIARLLDALAGRTG